MKCPVMKPFIMNYFFKSLALYVYIVHCTLYIVTCSGITVFVPEYNYIYNTYEQMCNMCPLAVTCSGGSTAINMKK